MAGLLACTARGCSCWPVEVCDPSKLLALALGCRHGEVSRAMRNRGIEVFLLPPHDELAAGAAAEAAGSAVVPGADEHAELRQVLALAGVPGGAVPAAMAAAHSAVAAHAGQRHR